MNSTIATALSEVHPIFLLFGAAIWLYCIMSLVRKDRAIRAAYSAAEQIQPGFMNWRLSCSDIRVGTYRRKHGYDAFVYGRKRPIIWPTSVSTHPSEINPPVIG